MELLIVRHAQPERMTAEHGSADPGLTELGRRQAEALAGWVSRRSEEYPERLVSSPMRRAQETAAAVAEQCGLTVEVDTRLAEFDLGSREYVPLEMLGVDHVAARAARALETGEWGSHRFDPKEFRQRVAAAFDDLVGAASAYRRVMVVCHGGVLNSYVSSVLRRPHGVFFMPRYTSVSRVVVGPDGAVRVGSLNELPHAETLTG